MNVIKKMWFQPQTQIPEYALQELSEYEFNGNIELSLLPIFPYEKEKHFVIDCPGDYEKFNSVIINGELLKLEKLTVSSVQTERIRLSKNYNLQDFFNEHKNAKCIVFFLCGNTIFHEGYTIRVFVDK